MAKQASGILADETRMYASEPASGKPYFAGIDLLRCFAAAVVALFHYTWLNPLYQQPALSWGWIGVEIFFVISGTVIAGSLLSSSPAGFFRARFLRIYPTAWLCGIVSLLAIIATGQLPYDNLGIHVASYPAAVLGSTVLIYPAWIASSYWTLPVELSFYAMVWLVLVCGITRNALQIAAVLMAVSTPYYVGLAGSKAFGWDESWFDLGYGLKNMSLLRHGPYFALGIYLFQIITKGALTGPHRLMMIVSLAFCLTQIVDRAFALHTQYVAPTDAVTLSMSACAVFLLSIVFLLTSSRVLARFLTPATIPVIRALGLLTYPFYLLHEAVGGALLSLLDNSAMAVFIAVTAVGVLAHGIVRLERMLVSQLQPGRLGI